MRRAGCVRKPYRQVALFFVPVLFCAAQAARADGTGLLRRARPFQARRQTVGAQPAEGGRPACRFFGLRAHYTGCRGRRIDAVDYSVSVPPFLNEILT